MEPPIRKPLFYRIFKIISTPYIFTLITTISQQEINRYLYRFKMVSKHFIFISRYLDFGENLKKKNTFRKEFFNEIWLKLGDYEYILLLNKIGIISFWCDFRDANYFKKRRNSSHFYSLKEVKLIFRQLQNLSTEILQH